MTFFGGDQTSEYNHHTRKKIDATKQELLLSCLILDDTIIWCFCDKGTVCYCLYDQSWAGITKCLGGEDRKDRIDKEEERTLH